jgi:hypothetical protein
MKALLVAALLAIMAGSAAAQSAGLSGAIERQREDIRSQQDDARREGEQQRRNLQQQQDQNLQFQLQLRQQQPFSLQAPRPNCQVPSLCR